MYLSRPSGRHPPTRPARSHPTIAGLTALLAAAALGPGGDLGAQGVDLRLVPAGGVMFATSVLYRSDLPEATAQFANAPVVSLGLQAHSPGFPLSARLTLDRAGWFDTDVEGIVQAGVHPFTVPTTITLVTGDLLVHPRVGWDRVDPYAFAGFGWKDYSFGEEEPRDDVGFNFPEDGSGGRIHYGLGAEVGMAGQPVAVELGGNYNRFVLRDDETGATRAHPQHEYVLRLAVPITIASF